MIYQKFKKKSLKLKRITNTFFLSFLLFILISNNLFSADVALDDIYRFSETNGIAESICKAIDMSTVLMVPLFAIMFTILGFGAYQGNVKWSSFVTFALGIAAFKGAGSIAEWFMPQMGLQYGCKCAIEKHVRDQNGVVKRYATGLNYDCSDGFVDYYEEYGEDVVQEIKKN